MIPRSESLFPDGLLEDPPFLPIDALGPLAGQPEAAREAFGAPAEGVYLVLPFVDGPSAFELGVALQSFTAGAVAALVAAVAGRLALLPPGAAHGDLKPENLLIDQEGRVHLIDFKVEGGCGTSGYSAPEAPERPAAARDLYALGRLGLALWSGRLPQGGPSHHVPEPPMAPAELPSGLRLAHSQLAALLWRLVGDDFARAPPAQEAAATAAELCRALTGGEPEVVLRDLVARVPSLERRALLADRLHAAPSNPRGRAAAPSAPGRARRLAPWAGGVALAFAIGAFALGANRARAPAPTHYAADDLPNLQVAADGLPIAHVLGPTANGTPDRMFFSIHVTNRIDRLTLSVFGGSVVWTKEHPPLDAIYRFALAPGTFEVSQTHPNGHVMNRVFPAIAGDVSYWETEPYALHAPVH